MANQLGMAEQQSIIVLAKRGWSYRRIARTLGIHRETVSRYVGLTAASTVDTTGPPGVSHPARKPGFRSRRSKFARRTAVLPRPRARVQNPSAGRASGPARFARHATESPCHRRHESSCAGYVNRKSVRQHGLHDESPPSTAIVAAVM